jgi:hypothetical protein
VKNKERKRNPTDGPNVKSGDTESRKIASVVLEVLAGVLRPSEAAKVLEINLPGYYKLELRALEGLVKACEPVSKGPKANPHKEIQSLKQQINKLKTECMRYQSLARAAGRAVGLNIQPDKGKRKPPVRALKVARALKPKELKKEVK